MDRFFSATRLLFLFFSLFFVSGPCASLSCPSRQLFSVSYRIVSYRTRYFHHKCGRFIRMLLPILVSIFLILSSMHWTLYATNSSPSKIQLAHHKTFRWSQRSKVAILFEAVVLAVWERASWTVILKFKQSVLHGSKATRRSFSLLSILPEPFLPSYSGFDFIFPYFSFPGRALDYPVSWPSRQLLSAS